MKHAVIVHKFKTWLKDFSPDYLDETSELKFEADELHHKKKGQEYNPKPWEAYEYLDKERMGLVYVEGFLWRKVGVNEDGSFTHQRDLSPEVLKTRINREWKTHTDKYPDLQATHHRLVFSLSQEFKEKMVNSGLNADEVLKEIVTKTMKNYQDKYHPGDQIGYCYGIHHDTDNLHAHIFVHPRTRDGERTSFSSPLKGRKATKREDKLGFVKKSAQTQIKMWIKKVETPAEMEKLKRHLRSEDFFYNPKIGVEKRGAVDREFRSLEHQREQISKLDKEIAEAKEQLRSGRSESMARRLLGINNVWIRLGIEIGKEIAWARIREKQKERAGMIRFYSASLKKRKDGLRTVIKPITTHKYSKTGDSEGKKLQSNRKVGYEQRKPTIADKTKSSVRTKIFRNWTGKTKNHRF